MNQDVYLSGYADTEWREIFKNTIARDITVFDPFTADYSELDRQGKAELTAKELENLETCDIVVFYFCKKWDSCYSMIQLGDAVGGGQHVIVHIETGMESEDKIRWYCEYRGVMVVDNIEDLVENIEEYLAQSEMAKTLNF